MNSLLFSMLGTSEILIIAVVMTMSLVVTIGGLALVLLALRKVSKLTTSVDRVADRLAQAPPETGINR